MSANWRSSEVALIAELVRLAGQCIDSDCMQITPKMYNDDNKKKQLVIALNMTKVIRHFWQAIELHNTEKPAPVFDANHPMRATADMRPWRTGSR